MFILVCFFFVFFFKQKTAYEMRISDWSSDVCSSDLAFAETLRGMYAIAIHDPAERRLVLARDPFGIKPLYYVETSRWFAFASEPHVLIAAGLVEPDLVPERRDELLQLQFTCGRETVFRSEEHTSELQSLMRLSYAVFC